MKVLIACEYSGIIRSAFERFGHYALSADFLPSEVPGHHYTGKVLDLLDQDWDLMIAHPPCTYLCKAQLYMCEDPARKKKQGEAIEFAKKLLWSKIPRVAIENPAGILANVLKPADQFIHPYMFGDQYKKEICLWLKNLPPLKIPHPRDWATIRKPVANHTNGRMTAAQKSKIKSRFFYHTAEAMAMQWGSLPLVQSVINFG